MRARSCRLASLGLLLAVQAVRLGAAEPDLRLVNAAAAQDKAAIAQLLKQ